MGEPLPSSNDTGRIISLISPQGLEYLYVDLRTTGDGAELRCTEGINRDDAPLEGFIPAPVHNRVNFDNYEQIVDLLAGNPDIPSVGPSIWVGLRREPGLESVSTEDFVSRNNFRDNTFWRIPSNDPWAPGQPQLLNQNRDAPCVAYDTLNHVLFTAPCDFGLATVLCNNDTVFDNPTANPTTSPTESPTIPSPSPEGFQAVLDDQLGVVVGVAVVLSLLCCLAAVVMLRCLCLKKQKVYHVDPNSGVPIQEQKMTDVMVKLSVPAHQAARDSFNPASYISGAGSQVGNNSIISSNTDNTTPYAQFSPTPISPPRDKTPSF